MANDPRCQSEGSLGTKGLRSLGPALGPSNHHIDLSAAAFRADQPFAPLGNGHFGAVPRSHLGGIGLNLMLAFLAPDDQPDAGGGSVAERQR